MTHFQYDPAIIARYPHTVGGVIIASGMQNGPSFEALVAAYQAEQEQVKARIGETPLSELPTLAAWREVFRGFGVNPTKYRSAPEALLRRLTKKGDIPSINTLVDIGNLVSIRYGLPVAIFDTRDVTGPITVKFSDGIENFTELGSDEVKHPEAGEVIFADDNQMVVARRWCWRQSASSAANPKTTNAVIVIEAQHASAQEDVESAQADLLALLEAYAGGSSEPIILNAGRLVV